MLHPAQMNGWTLFAWLAAFAPPVLAAAQPPHEPQGLTLNWPAVESCPTGDQVLAEVARLLGGRIPAEPEIHATVTLRPGLRWRLQIVTQRGQLRGERLPAPECDATAGCRGVGRTAGNA